MTPGQAPDQAIARVFTAPALSADWFTPAFLAAVPLPKLEELRRRIAAEAGPFVTVEPRGDGWRAVFERAAAEVTVTLAGERLAGLWIGPLLPLDESLEAVVAALEALPGEVSLLVRRDGETLAALRPERPLSVGSAFKLAVLLALTDEVAAGRAAWDEVLALAEADRSLPTGTLQDWASGAPLTLYALAALMVSQSDNTATDALIRRLGRERVEALLPAAARPLPTTREVFLLGGAAHAADRAAFLAGDTAARRRILAALAGQAPSLADYLAGDPGPLPGWELSAADLCGLMERLSRSPLLAINPGLASRSDGAWVGFKGGSQPGVLNLTTGLVDAAGRRVCVAATWNRPGLEAARFEALYARLLAATLSAAR